MSQDGYLGFNLYSLNLSRVEFKKVKQINYEIFEEVSKLVKRENI